MNDDQRNESSQQPEWRVPREEQLETDAYHVWKPRPLLRSVHWKPVPAPSRDGAAGSYDVFLDQRVFTAIHQHLWHAAPGEEPFGFLVGDLCEDPDTGRRYLIVSAAVPSKFPLAEDETAQIPGEALVAMQLEVDRRRGVLAGWYHRHRAGEVALTAEDVATHERHFPEPWQIGLLFVTDYHQPAGGCFRRTRDGLAGDAPLAFFEMVSNESLLPRGVRRSNMDWTNVETVDAVERKPPPRPEPEPEPEVEPVFESEPEPEPEAESDVEPELEADYESAVAEPEESTVPSSEAGAGVEDTPGGGGGEDVSFDLPTIDESELPEVPAGPEESESESLTLEAMDELLASEDELALPVIDDPAEGFGDEDLDLESLPEPGWDSGGADAEGTLDVVDDTDLDSFVTEVEKADVTAQVGEPLDPALVEPDWDEAGDGDADPLIVDQLAVAPAADLDQEDVGETVEEPVEPPSDSVQEPDAKRPKPGRTARSHNSLIIVAGFVVVAAIVASLFVFAGPSGSEPEADPAGQPASVEELLPEQGTGELDGGMSSDAGEAPSDAGEGTPPVASDSTGDAATVEEFEELGDTLLEAISRYYGRAVAVDAGQATCAELRTAYVAVDDSWIAYNVQGKARFRGRLPDELATRDDRLYAGVQDVEREFARSGCERP